jgi:hypothetical protein
VRLKINNLDKNIILITPSHINKNTKDLTEIVYPSAATYSKWTVADRWGLQPRKRHNYIIMKNLCT